MAFELDGRTVHLEAEVEAPADALSALVAGAPQGHFTIERDLLTGTTLRVDWRRVHAMRVVPVNGSGLAA